MPQITPEALVPICSLLSAVGVKLIDVLHDKMKENRQKKSGEMTMSEKLDKIISDQNEMKKQIRLSGNVTLATARDRIFYLCEKYTSEKRFGTKDLEDIEDLYAPYKAAGGNGLAQEVLATYKEAYHEYHRSQIGGKGEKHEDSIY